MTIISYCSRRTVRLTSIDYPQIEGKFTDYWWTNQLILLLQGLP